VLLKLIPTIFWKYLPDSGFTYIVAGGKSSIAYTKKASREIEALFVLKGQIFSRKWFDFAHHHEPVERHLQGPGRWVGKWMSRPGQESLIWRRL